jgi:hypothetical protein
MEDANIMESGHAELVSAPHMQVWNLHSCPSSGMLKQVQHDGNRQDDQVKKVLKSRLLYLPVPGTNPRHICESAGLLKTDIPAL